MLPEDSADSFPVPPYLYLEATGRKDTIYVAFKHANRLGHIVRWRKSAAGQILLLVIYQHKSRVTSPKPLSGVPLNLHGYK